MLRRSKPGRAFRTDVLGLVWPVARLNWPPIGGAIKATDLHLDRQSVLASPVDQVSVPG